MKLSGTATLREMMEAFVETFGNSHSLYGLVLTQGREYTPAPKPNEIKQGIPKWCFDNSIEVNKLHGLAYVEGFAISRKLHMPIHHAWNVTPDGIVVDVTWVPEGLDYFGVEIDLEADEYDRDSWLTPLGVMTD